MTETTAGQAEPIRLNAKISDAHVYLRRELAGQVLDAMWIPRGEWDAWMAAATAASRPAVAAGAARFALDETKAAEYVNQAPDGHQPGDYHWRAATERLVHHAVDLGVITDPLHYDAVTLALEILPGGVVTGPSYRWLLSVDTGPEPDDYITLASPADELDALTGCTGRPAALEVLRAAVDAGNMLADDLDRYAASLPAPEVTPAAVWILDWSHRHGSDITAYATEDLALAARAAIARDGWDNITGCGDGVPDSPDGLSDADAAGMYFGHRPDETCSTIAADVSGTVPMSALPLAFRAPEVAELLAQLPAGEWGATELGTLANWLEGHGLIPG